MTFSLSDRVQEQAIVSGTGSITLSGTPVAGFRNFASVLPAGGTTWYTIVDPISGSWEVGLGTWNSPTLARTTVYSSSNNGSLVNFAGHLCNVFQDLPASQAINPANTISANSVLANTGTVTASGSSLLIGDSTGVLTGFGAFVGIGNTLVGTPSTSYYLTAGLDPTGTGYYAAARVPDTVHTGLPPVTLSGTSQITLANFITPPNDPGAIAMGFGSWENLFYGNVDGGSVSLAVRVLARHLDGTETNLGTSESVTFSATTPGTPVRIRLRKPGASAMASTDRLVFRVLATRIASSPPTVALTMAIDTTNLRPTASTSITGTGVPNPGYEFNVMAFGAVGDAKSAYDGVMTNGSTNLQSLTTTFKPSDVTTPPKKVHVNGAHGPGQPPLIADLVGYVDAHNVTLSAPATADTSGIQTLDAAAVVNGGDTGYYVAGDIVPLLDGTFTVQASGIVINTTVRPDTDTTPAVAVVNPGSLGTRGNYIFQGTTGTGRVLQVKGIVGIDGTLQSVSLVSGGIYITNPGTTAEPITDNLSGLQGATISIAGIDAAVVGVNNGGFYTDPPDDPIDTSAGSISGATGLTLDGSWTGPGRFVWGTNDRDAIANCITAAINADLGQTRRDVILPARFYLITGAALPVMNAPVRIQGGGEYQTVIFAAEGYGSSSLYHVIGWSDNFDSPQGAPLGAPVSLFTLNEWGAGAIGIEIQSDLTNTVLPDAFVMYDRAARMYFDNFGAQNVGSAFRTGIQLNTVASMMRESFIQGLYARNCGSATNPVVDIMSRSAADGCNYLTFRDINIVFPHGIGWRIDNQGGKRGGVKQITGYNIRIEQGNTSLYNFNQLQINSPDSTNSVVDVYFDNCLLVGARPGCAAIALYGSTETTRPYRIGFSNIRTLGPVLGTGIEINSGWTLHFDQIEQLTARTAQVATGNHSDYRARTTADVGSSPSTLVTVGGPATDNGNVGAAAVHTVTADISCHQTGTTLTVNAIGAGQRIVIGGLITGPGVMWTKRVISQINGTPGGLGDYQVSNSQSLNPGPNRHCIFTQTRYVTGYTALTRTSTIDTCQGSSATWDSVPQAGDPIFFQSLVDAPIYIDGFGNEQYYEYDLGTGVGPLISSPLLLNGDPGGVGTISRDIAFTGATSFTDAIITDGTIDGLDLGALAPGQIVYSPGTGSLANLAIGTNLAINSGTLNATGGGGGGGTVTSVIGGTALSGGTITTSGTLAVTSAYAQIPFTVTGASSSATLSARFGDMPDAVRDFGVPTNGTSDAGPAITTAAATLAAAGTNYLIVPNPGVQYVIGTPIVLPSNFNLIFTGNPTLRLTATNGRVLNLTGKSNIIVAGKVTIDGTSITFSNTDSVLLITATSQVRVFDWNIQSAPKDVQILNGSDHIYLYRFFYSNGGNNGLTIQNSTNIWIEDFEASGQPGFGIFVDCTSAGTTKNIELIRPKSLSSGRELVGVPQLASYVNVWFPHSESSSDNGISLTGSHCQVVGGLIYQSARHGVAIYGSDNVVIGTEILDCGTNTAANYDGVYVNSDYGGVAKNAIVADVKSYDETGSPTMYYALYIGTGYGTWATGVTVGSLSPGGLNSGYCQNASHIYSTTNPVTDVTGSTAPTHTSGTVSDGNVLWTYVTSYTTSNTQGAAWVTNPILTAGRSGTAFIDLTTSLESVLFTASRIQTSNYTMDSNGIVVRGSNIGMRKTATAWAASQTIVYGDVRSNAGRCYICTNVGGTTANAPVQTSGSVTGADGITWLMLIAAVSFPEFVLGNARTQLLGYDIEAVDNSGTTVSVFAGTGSPAGVVSAPIGSLYHQYDGSVGTALWVKESGTGTSGWAALITSAGVTSVAQTFTGGLISVSGSPITSSGTLALTVAGNVGGIPYFNSGTSWASSSVLANLAVMVGGGSSGVPTASTSITTNGTASLNLGAVGVANGHLNLFGTTSGVITVSPQSAAGTYNFNLPTTAGSSGQVLTSGGGVAAAMTWTTPTTGTVTSVVGGTGLSGGTITTTGTLSVSAATTAALGGVIVGSGLSVSSGTVSTVGTIAASTLAQQIAFYASNASTSLSGAGTAFYNGSGQVTLGLAASSTGKLALAGTTSGAVTIQPQGAAGTYNFNLPTTAGNAGDVLTSQGGLTSAMTWTTPTTGTVTSIVAGTGLTGGTITTTGTVAVAAATTATLGGVIVGSGLSISGGTLTAGASSFVTASSTTPFTLTPGTISNGSTLTLGVTGGTTTGVLYFANSTSLVAGAGLTTNNVVLGSTTGPKTVNGIATDGNSQLTLGNTGGPNTGKLQIKGSSTGVITVTGDAANTIGTWTMVLPSSAGTSGQPLLSNGGTTTSGSTMTFGTLGAAAGGTGQTSWTTNTLVYASGTAALSGAVLPPNWAITSGTIVPSSTVTLGLSNNLTDTITAGTYDLGPIIQGGTVLNSYAHVASGTLTYTGAIGQPGTYTTITGMSALTSSSTTIDTIGTATAANVVATGAHLWVIVGGTPPPGGSVFFTVKVP